MAKRFHEAYGVEAMEQGWDNPESMLNKYYYRAAVAFIGGFLLLISIHLLLSYPDQRASITTSTASKTQS